MKIAGSKSLAGTNEGWAYVIDWLREGEPDDDVSDAEFDGEGRLMRRNNRGDLVEVHNSQPCSDAQGHKYFTSSFGSYGKSQTAEAEDVLE